MEPTRSPAPPPMPSERRAFIENVVLAGVLPGVAGAVNASGFLAVGVYTSHVTGLVGRFGDEVAQSHPSAALSAASLVGMFLFGAITATVMIDAARDRARARYSMPLLLQAAVLAVFAVLAARPHPSSHGVPLAALLCFSMGLQNALVTRISGAVVRTTHLTGIVTDLGIELVHLGSWLRRRLLRLRNLRRPGRIARLLVGGREWKKLRLHVMIFVSFVSGAVVGPGLLLRYGQRAMVLPCALLVILATGDYLWGFRVPHHEPL